MTKIKYQSSLPIDWTIALKKESLGNSLDTPLNNVIKELERNKEITPDIDSIFKAFELCSYKSTKVVIFGQDPYFQKGYANGLAFNSLTVLVDFIHIQPSRIRWVLGERHN